MSDNQSALPETRVSGKLLFRHDRSAAPTGIDFRFRSPRRPIDKAAHEVGPTDTPLGARDATWSMVIAGIDPDPAKAAVLIILRQLPWEGVHPYNLGGCNVNFMSDDDGDARVKASYGVNYARLVAVKRKYDP